MILQTSAAPKIIYPDDDGNPISNNTEQFDWIVTIKENLELLFAQNPNVFVAGDLLWYPVEGNNTIRSAPDAMVVFGRPKGKADEVLICSGLKQELRHKLRLRFFHLATESLKWQKN